MNFRKVRRALKYISIVAALNLLWLNAVTPDPSQEPLTEAALFARCYSNITGLDLPLNHPLRAQVKAGTLTAVAACMQLLDSANLNASGANEGQVINNTAESRAILSNINDFHRSWFPNDDLGTANGGDAFPATAVVHDQTEPALHLTRVLFTPSLPISEIVRGMSGLEALRTGGPSPYDANQSADQKISGFPSAAYSETRVPFNIELVQTGELTGVRKLSLNANKMSKTFYTSDGYPSPIQIHQSLGGGILGSKAYMILNLGRPDRDTMNGGLRMPRRWSKAIFNDLLCRDLPVLRASDALALVQTTVSAATPAFRKSSSCMACHGTMDPMGAAARNVSLAIAAGGVESNTYHTAIWATNRTAETGIVDDDPNYYARPPNGKLYYRSYDGTLVSQMVTGVSGLGDSIAQSNDLYVCVAARYFKFFTGVGVNLQDIGDTNLPALDNSEKMYRDYVIQLGMGLKTNQSVRTLIQSILNSGIYRSISQRNYGTP